MKWFNIIKDFKYSHGKYADPKTKGMKGYQGVPIEAGGFSRGRTANVNLSANAWKRMLYGRTDISLEDLESGNYDTDNEMEVIEQMSDTLSHEYAHVLFKETSGYTGVESEMAQPLSDIFLGLILDITDRDVFDLEEQVDKLVAASKKNASILILDELYAGYAGKSVEGISRLIVDKYKDYWYKDFNNTLQRVKSGVIRNISNALGQYMNDDLNPMSELIFNIRVPIAEQHLDKILEMMEEAWSDSVDFIYGHFVRVQQKRFYLGTLPENEDKTVGMMVSMISRYLEKAGYDDIQRYISGGELDDKVLEEIGFSRRN